ncbi:MAG: efflux transporter outer membrane subunit [Casimicrobiaceae bacterium]
MIALLRGTRCAGAFLGVALLVGGCVVAPTYERATTPLSPTFKEAEGWVAATPADTLPRGPWWTLFDDPTLTALEVQVESANQTVAAAIAAYEQARALVREQRAGLFPAVTLDGGASRNRSAGVSRSSYQVSIGGSWEPDLFGRLKETVTAASASAQASAADLAAARLAAQGELAANYFNLRALDAQRDLLATTITSYTRNLQINQNRYDQGIIPRTDVLQAKTQLANSQADLVGLESQRAQLEHAIAVLIGEAPGNFTLPVAAWQEQVPAVPPAVPSVLLQRRPDIAAAERRMAAANAQIGIARSAFYPSFNLNGSLGQGGARLADLFSASGTLWSLGVQVAQTLFDAGARKARVAGAEAAYEAALARYRATALAALQDVENQLVATRVLREQEALRREASVAADQVEQQVLNRYRAGLVNYTEVVTAQATALTARRNLVQLMAARQATAVALIQALGGGWQDSDLPGAP